MQYVRKGTWLYLVAKNNDQFRWLIKPLEIYLPKGYNPELDNKMFKHKVVVLFKFIDPNTGKPHEKFIPGKEFDELCEWNEIRWRDFDAYKINSKEFEKFKEEAMLLRL